MIPEEAAAAATAEEMKAVHSGCRSVDGGGGLLLLGHINKR